MGNRNVWGLGLGGIVAALLVLAPPATATPPGENGPIIWQSYTGPAYEIWMMDPDGSNEDQLTDNTSHDERAQISPDGSKIAFMSQRDIEPGDSIDIWQMDADGTNQVQLTDNDVFESEPTWSPDGNTIVFAGPTDLWSIPEGGGTPTNLTNTPIAYECCPEFSPDGTKIAFTINGHVDGNPVGPYEENEIYVMNANGSNQQPLTDNTAQDVGPTWSPDGERIAWANVDNGSIWTMDANGTNPAALTGASGYYAPVWSPDGTRIAAAFGSAEIYSVGVANPLTDVVNLTMSPGVQDEYPSWAPAAGGGGEPDTEITKKPKDVIKKDKAKYEFESTPPAGASFECKLDKKPYKSCSSPHEVKNLSKGDHKFRVRAKVGGVADPTPASDTFKVKP